MRYQSYLGTEEHKVWIKLETNLGNNNSLIDTDKVKLLSFLKSFSEIDVDRLEEISGFKVSSNVTELPVNKTTVRLLMIKKFIDRNKPNVIAEALNLVTSGRSLEINIFLKIADNLFKEGVYPEDIYAYSTFRRRGSPTTWLKINNSLSNEELELLIDSKIKSLCNKLTYKLHFRRRLRIKQKVNNFLIYILEKPAGADVARTEDSNQEIQKIGYSILAVNLNDKKIGYVSNSKKEVLEAQKFIKERTFPGEVFRQRNDVEINPQDLLNKLLAVDIENSSLEIIGCAFKKANLPNSPFFELKSSDDTAINEAILNVRALWNGVDITGIKSIDYKFQNQKVNLYTYGDKWKRRYLSISSKGNSKTIEDIAIIELEKILGSQIKETSFIVQKLELDFIIQEILKEKIVLVDPPIPASVEKLIVDLVKKKLLKKPRKLAKRKCSDWNCGTVSWSEWLCPNCGKQMNLIGEGITIELSATTFIKELTSFLTAKLQGYMVTQQQIQRKKYTKQTIRIVSENKDVAIYIVPVSSRKDLSFCEALSKEGYGLIAVCDPNMNSKKEEIKLYGSEFVELPVILAELSKTLDNNASVLKDIISSLLLSQEQNMLTRIQQGLVNSSNTLQSKGGNYDEDVFEIDIKNVFQALVPNVVRLGTKFKGKSVPDGYCSFKVTNVKTSYLFGWDAKYSFSSSYKLHKKDLDKQRNYIKWLITNKEPKVLGRLRMYAIISNFDDTSGLAKVLTALKKSAERPRLCRIALIHDSILSELSLWMQTNWKAVIEKGPQISQTFFEWILSNTRKKKRGWTLCDRNDWQELKGRLENL